MNARASSLSALVAIALFVSVVGTAHAERSLGLGVHYLRNLGDISDDGAVDLNQNSASLIGSIKSDLGPLKLDGQVEYIFDYIGTGDEMWQPSLWLLLGGFIYGGGGMGIGYTNNEWQIQPILRPSGGCESTSGRLGPGRLRDVPVPERSGTREPNRGGPRQRYVRRHSSLQALAVR